MATDFNPDPRLEQYRVRARMQGDKGPAVTREPGTRIYRESGDEHHMRWWINELQKIFEGQLLPFEWVAEYVGISRAALHKRVKRGGLTVFVFEVTEKVTGILGGKRERMRQEYKCVPITECEDWRNQLWDEALAERQRQKDRERFGY